MPTLVLDNSTNSISRHKRAPRAILVVGLVCAGLLATLPPGPGRMIGLTLAVFFGMKYVSLDQVGHVAFAEALPYFLAWPGLDAKTFFGPRRPLPPAGRRTWAIVVGNTLIALIALWGAARWMPTADPLWTGIMGMGAIILIFHSAIFLPLVVFWRRQGVPVEPIMNRPLAARALSEFWGQRWNLAFHDFGHAHLFRPLRPRLGALGAALVVFLFSGLVHDLAISGGAAGGYGLPTLYFLWQALGVWWERTPLGRLLSGRVMTALWLLLPLPLLFHRPFGAVVIAPLLRHLAAL